MPMGMATVALEVALQFEISNGILPCSYQVRLFTRGYDLSTLYPKSADLLCSRKDNF